MVTDTSPDVPDVFQILRDMPDAPGASGVHDMGDVTSARRVSEVPVVTHLDPMSSWYGGLVVPDGDRRFKGGESGPCGTPL